MQDIRCFQTEVVIDVVGVDIVCVDMFKKNETIRTIVCYRSTLLSRASLDVNKKLISCLLDPFSTSDHLTISFSIFFPDNEVDPCSFTDQAVRPDPIKLSVYDWSAANFDAIDAILGTIDWHPLFGYHFGADSMWSEFKGIIWPLIDQFVPKS